MGIAQANNCDRIEWESSRKFGRIFPDAKVRYAYSIDVEGIAE